MPTEFTVKVGKVGNSMRVVLPKPVVNGLKWGEGTVLRLTVKDSTVELKKAD